MGVIVQFGGQTPLNLALPLKAAGVSIIGTSPESIDLAEDRKRFGKLLDELQIPQPAGAMATSVEEAVEGARRTHPENGSHQSGAEAADGFDALARAAEAVQDVLGEHRDGILLALQVEARSEGVDAPAAARLAGLARDVRHEAEQRLAGLDTLVDAVVRAAAHVN